MKLDSFNPFEYLWVTFKETVNPELFTVTKHKPNKFIQKYFTSEKPHWDLSIFDITARPFI